MGEKHGAQWAVEYPSGHYFWPYWMWEMCADNPGWRTYMADTCARIIEETGADGVRIDEMGGASRICSNDRHPHTFAREGQYQELQAQADMARMVRQAIDNVDPTAVLMTETPGIDILGQYVDGSLDYGLTNYVYTGHVAGKWEGFVGINVNRFYFPRHKLFEYQFKEKHPEWRFFNADGAFNREWFYRAHELNILKDNADAFGTLSPEPMIDTHSRYVFANRFPAVNKTVYTLYNSSWQDFRGEILSVAAQAGYHFVDLYTYRPLSSTENDGDTTVSIHLEARKAGALAYLPTLMSVSMRNKLTVRLKREVDQALLKVVDPQGKTVSEVRPEHSEEVTITGAFDRQRVIVKLYQGKYVVDAVAVDLTDQP